MATTKTNRWVVCEDYAAGPYKTETAAEKARVRCDASADCPFDGHEVVIADRRPETEADRRTAEWEDDS